MPALPSWLTEPLWDQFAVLLPERPEYHPDHPLGCHRRRISDRIIFDKMLQLLRFGCSYEAIADTTCSATTASTTWVRCPTRSPSTWTPATTRTRPARCSTNAACTAASRTKGRRRPSRPVSAGTSNAPMHAERLPPARPLLRAARPRCQRILRPHPHDHHRAQPDPASMDDSPLGRTPQPPTMTAPLSAPPLSPTRPPRPPRAGLTPAGAFRARCETTARRAGCGRGRKAYGPGSRGARPVDAAARQRGTPQRHEVAPGERQIPAAVATSDLIDARAAAALARAAGRPSRSATGTTTSR